MGLPGWRWSVNCWSTGWLWFVVIWVLRTACTELGISKDRDPHSLSVPFTALTQKSLPYFLSTCPAVKTAVKSPSCWDVSFSIFWHICGPRPSHCVGSCWACSCFPLGIREPTAGHSTSEAVSLKCQVEGNNLVCPCDTEEKLSLWSSAWNFYSDNYS